MNSTPEVVPVKSESMEELLPLLAVFRANNPRLDRQYWRGFFSPPWPTPSDVRGFALKCDGKFVGFSGLILCLREIDGQSACLINYSTWVVLPEFRKFSFKMSSTMDQFLRENEAIPTIFSTMPALVPLYKAYGLAELETEQRVILPTPSMAGLRSSLRYSVRTKIVPEQLSPADRVIYEHHRPTHCHHLHIRGDDGECYMVYVRTKGRRRHFAHVLYLSDPAVFAKAIEKAKLAMLFHSRSVAIMIDERLMRGVPTAHSRQVPLGAPRFYWGGALRPEQVDNLYSEFVLLPS